MLGVEAMILRLAGAALVWLLFVAVAWVTFVRRAPSSPLEWSLLFALGPPAYIVASALGEGAFMLYGRLPGVRHLHAFAGRRGADSQLSWTRVGIRLLTI